VTFDEWADRIGIAVMRAYPHCSVKRKLDDMYRWAYGAKECQLHAVNESHATFISIRRETAWPRVPEAPYCVQISEQTQLEIAGRIIRWFGSVDYARSSTMRSP
jgi:endogenous inhibitor of DNA gyrase (YacG/DUF329 family)